MKTPSEFTLNCSDQSFLQRQKNVFDQLFEIEKTAKTSHEEPMEEDKEYKNNEPLPRRTHRSVTRSFRGKESIFKMPQDPAPRNFLRRLPDYKKNPHKWTKYSLEDVRDEDISDKGNTKAALSFLKELNERNDEKIQRSSNDPSEELPKRIIFQKHASTVSKESNIDDKPSFRSSKIVMPEYVVGQKIKKEKKNKSIKARSDKKELKLDHLFEEDDQIE